MYQVSDFIEKIDNRSSFKIEELVSMAKRKNNAKREFLFVNHYLGKHVPVSASKLFQLFNEFEDRIRENFSTERILVVGFAETATALAQHVSYRYENVVYHAQTTRELVDVGPGKVNISFQEEHSHAVSQQLYIDEDLPDFDVILFIEDEITTGQTILNFIKAFDEKFPNKKYAVASILNWQDQQSRQVFEEKDIKRIALISGQIKAKLPNMILENEIEAELVSDFPSPSVTIPAIDPRLGMTRALFCMWVTTMLRKLGPVVANRDLDRIIGTEEFMYVPFCLAKELEEASKRPVLTHATTRSPIQVADISDYFPQSGKRLPSFYDDQRTTYIYDVSDAEKILVVSDSDNLNLQAFSDQQPKGMSLELVSTRDYFPNFVKTSYRQSDVVVLLQDVKGRVPILDTAERERLNQQGVHYSEMLPLEAEPTKRYLDLFRESLDSLSTDTSAAVAVLADKIRNIYGDSLVLVSLARAGTPVGVLVKRHLEKLGVTVDHYSISIIRGKGIDQEAVRMLLSHYAAENILFLDGWVGKGAINTVLKESIQDLQRVIPEAAGLSSDLAVLTDPAGVTNLYGTCQDFLIPSACLNATVSGLFSRTVKTKTMTDDELHGAVYYNDRLEQDLTYTFIDKIMSVAAKETDVLIKEQVDTSNPASKGIDEVRQIARDYAISDINKIKPGIGETTRVLLRRLPDRILVAENAPQKYLKHILQLANEKQVPVEYYPLQHYNACGLIKVLSDV